MSDLIQLVAQVEPWFENQALAGALLGGGFGIFGGVYGSLLGLLAPRGRARGLMVAVHWTALSLGVLLLVAGVTALVSDQPYGVWYALLLPGAIVTVVMGCLTPVLHIVYRQAEHRRLEAEEFRHT
jgi:hypothetical protein